MTQQSLKNRKLMFNSDFLCDFWVGFCRSANLEHQQKLQRTSHFWPAGFDALWGIWGT